MSTTHTPGPWRINTETAELIESKNGIIADLKPYTKFGEYHPFSVAVKMGTKEEIQANARLIAAAPELLVSLQEMINALRRGITTKADRKEFDNSGTVIKALQAIEKATDYETRLNTL